MKKVLCILMMLCLSCVTVYAEDTTIKAYMEKDTNQLTGLQVNEPDQMAVAVVYTPDNKVFDSQIVNIKDKNAELELLCPQTECTLKLYTDIGTDKSYSLSSDSIEYEEEEFVPVYGDTKAAIGAFAVVKNVEEMLNNNNDVVASITLLYRGVECVIEADTGYRLDNLEEGGTISVLDIKEGDILKLEANLSGALYGADLIFKAPGEDIVLDNEEAARLYTTIADEDNMSVFGIVADKLDDTLVLYNQSGLEGEALYLDLDPNTVVYSFDAKSKKEKTTISSVNEIITSEIASVDMDDDDNITNWDPEYKRVYAYVRVYDGIVCDVVLYSNL